MRSRQTIIEDKKILLRLLEGEGSGQDQSNRRKKEKGKRQKEKGKRKKAKTVAPKTIPDRVARGTIQTHLDGVLLLLPFYFYLLTSLFLTSLPRTL
jgi:hypothetical protein